MTKRKNNFLAYFLIVILIIVSLIVGLIIGLKNNKINESYCNDFDYQKMYEGMSKKNVCLIKQVVEDKVFIDEYIMLCQNSNSIDICVNQLIHTKDMFTAIINSC